MNKKYDNIGTVKVYEKELDILVNFYNYPEYSDSIAKQAIVVLLNTKYWAVARDKSQEAVHAAEVFEKAVYPIIYINRKDIELLADNREPAAVIKTPGNVEVRIIVNN